VRSLSFTPDLTNPSLSLEQHQLLNYPVLFLQDLDLDLSAHDQTAFVLLFRYESAVEGFLTRLLRGHHHEISPAAFSNSQLLL
jgi:hypothetical protein